jgi:hypothetical protein
MDNISQVEAQMRAFGVEFRDKDLPLTVGMAKHQASGGAA